MKLLKETQAHELVQSAHEQKVDLVGRQVLTQPFGDWLVALSVKSNQMPEAVELLKRLEKLGIDQVVNRVKEAP